MRRAPRAAAAPALLIIVEFLITSARRLGRPSRPCARSADSNSIQIEITISFSHKLCLYNKRKAPSAPGL
jgi:hypothetical protein